MIHLVLHCQANEIVTMSRTDRCWFHTVDPFCTMTFVNDGFYVSQTTAVLILVFDDLDSSPFHRLFENGHIATTLIAPTDSYVYVPLNFFDTARTTTVVNWTSTIDSSNEADFISNRVGYRYGTFRLMHYEASLFYDLSTELSDVLLNNEFTVLVSAVLYDIDRISISMFSDDPFEFTQLKNGATMFMVSATPTGENAWRFDEYVDDVYVRTDTRQRNHKNVIVRCTRNGYGQRATIKNVMVFPGKIIDATLNRIGEQNICIGFKAGYHTDHGSDNIFMGKECGNGNLQGNNNIAFGLRAYKSAEQGEDNICIGKDSGSANDRGHHNICIGSESGMQNRTGTSNIFIGQRSGYRNQGNNNIIVGNADQDGDDNIIIGNYTSMATGSSQLHIGNLISGDLMRKETVVHGSLRVEGGLTFKQSTVRLRVVTTYTSSELSVLFEYVILETAIEQFDILQIMEEDETMYLDFKLVQSDSPFVRWKVNGSDEEHQTHAPQLNASSSRETLLLNVTSTTVELSKQINE